MGLLFANWISIEICLLVIIIGINSWVISKIIIILVGTTIVAIKVITIPVIHVIIAVSYTHLDVYKRQHTRFDDIQYAS